MKASKRILQKTSRRTFLRAGLIELTGLQALRGGSASARAASLLSGKCRIAEVRIHPIQMRRMYRTKVAPAGGHGEGKDASIYLLVELVSDIGVTGVGELSDVEEGWHSPGAREVQRILSGALVGTDAFDRPQVLQQAAAATPVEWHAEMRRMLSSAVDMALVDLAGRTLDVPAYQLLGGRHQTRLPISWVAFIRDRASLEEEIRAKVAEGFGAFKLKVGENFAADCDHVRAIREITGPNARLKVDASGSWTEAEAIENIRRLAELGVDAVETPILAASRLTAKNHPEKVNQNVDEVARALARVRAAVPVEIIEHVVDFSDAFSVALVRHRAVDIFNVAPCQAGSLDRARRLLHLAEAAGLRVLLGSTVELGLGTAAALHLGVTSRSVTATSDLVGPGLLEDDVITKHLEYEDGWLRVPEGPGFGVSLDRKKLAEYYAKDFA